MGRRETPEGAGRRAGTKPIAAIAAIAAISHPVAASGLVTVFPAFGILGILKGALQNRLVRRASGLAVLWSAVTLLSAQVHGDKLVTQQALYGIVILLSLCGLMWIHESVGIRRESLAIIVGLGWLGLTALHGLVPDYTTNAWKYGIGRPITLILLGLLWRLRAPRIVSAAVLVGLGVVSFENDARFYTGLAVAVAVATLLHKRGRATRASMLRQLVVLVISIFAVLQLYPRLADAGYFGHRAQEQQQKLSQQGVNFLLANRPEALQSAWIAAHHPVLGIGPGTQLDNAETLRSIQFLIDRGLPIDNNTTRYLRGQAASQNYRGLGYATHSSAIDAVRHGGLLAAPFWIFFMFLMIRIVLTRAREEVFAVPTLLWLGLLVLWDSLFSPLASTQWPEIALSLFLAATARVPHEVQSTDDGDAPEPVREATSTLPARGSRES